MAEMGSTKLGNIFVSTTVYSKYLSVSKMPCFEETNGTCNVIELADIIEIGSPNSKLR